MTIKKNLVFQIKKQITSQLDTKLLTNEIVSAKKYLYMDDIHSQFLF